MAVTVVPLSTSCDIFRTRSLSLRPPWERLRALLREQHGHLSSRSSTHSCYVRRFSYLNPAAVCNRGLWWSIRRVLCMRHHPWTLRDVALRKLRRSGRVRTGRADAWKDKAVSRTSAGSLHSPVGEYDGTPQHARDEARHSR